MISKDSELADVAFAVCTALSTRSLAVVLVGGSAATYYAPTVCQSMDADFIAQFHVDRETEQTVVDAMAELGYRVKDNLFLHALNQFTVDFPKGPLAVGGDLIKLFDSIHRGDEVLNIISPTDSVRDRLAKFYFWDDYTGLDAALGVARERRGDIDFGLISRWSLREGESEKLAVFQRELAIEQRGHGTVLQSPDVGL